MSAGGAVGWDDPRTARRYERFCERHERYRDANDELVRHAALGPGLRVLDVGAGTGRTAEAAIARLGRDDRIVCVERAAAMRSLGRRRLREARFEWRATLPRRAGSFDRVLCGAAIWQMTPLDRALARLARLVSPGGAHAFDVPSAYLGLPDDPGGGRDPYLTEISAALAEGQPVRGGRVRPLVGADAIESALRAAGLVPERWGFRRRVTQAEMRDWMKIPVLTDRLLAGLPPAARDRLVDRAWRRVDHESWRWEAWTGWTAWRGVQDVPRPSMRSHGSRR